jgi:group I intron endonuclease
MVSGIYLITNIVNQKRYVGSSNNVAIRWQNHKSLATHRKHPNPHFGSAFRKYGSDKFKIDILEEVLNQNDLITIEQYYLDWLEPEYNMNPVAAKPPSQKGRSPSEETRAKLSVAIRGQRRSAETCAKIGTIHRGKHLSEKHRASLRGDNNSSKRPEVRAKISAANKGRSSPMKGKHHSAETKMKLSVAFLGKPSQFQDPNKKAKTGKPGHPHTEEHRASMCGDNNSSKRADVCAKIGAAQKAAWARRKAAQGKVNTPEAKI